MQVTITALEFESMLFVRHLTLTAARRSGTELDRSAYTILTCLYDGRVMSMGELSATLGLDVSTLSRQTTAMLNSGLVERIPDPGGGMARKFRATSEGEARLREACGANMRVLEDVTGDWTAEDLDVFTRLLGRFNRGIETLDQRPWPRPALLEDEI